MITESELQAAIAECMGERNPNANTCIKLAAYYTVLSNLYPEKAEQQYSFDAPALVESVVVESGTEFARTIKGKPTADVIKVLDELMTVIQVLKPNLYEGVLRKLREI